MRRRTGYRGGGFTLLELLIVIGVIGFGISLLIPSLCKSRETANRVKCQSNLSQLGKALLLYSNENKGAFPRTHFVEGAPIQLTNDGFANANPFAVAPTPGTTNNIPAALFLLVRTEDMTTEVFTCPSGTAEKDLMDKSAATSRGNFMGDGKPGGAVTRHVSYGFVNVYAPASPSKPSAFITAQPSDFAVAADLSPYPPGHADLAAAVVGAPRSVMVKANSTNHDRDGQNVLYADGHAEFQQSPLCGMNNDNIYTAADPGASDPKAGRSGPGDVPQSPTDSVLLIHGS